MLFNVLKAKTKSASKFTIKFNKNKANFKNSESSENSEKCTESKNNNNDEEFKNVSHLIQV